ncbi:MAG TPA: hypothetical protein VME41_09480 [Stellaceae bacterium]|nr:hypothetical protein [Stellaceae bacterium]
MNFVRGLAGMLFALVLGSPQAPAAGIDARAYSCAGLHSIIAQRGYVFLSQPAFGDFVVAGASSCLGGQSIQLRSVPTRDNPQCIVNYCVNIPPLGPGGGGM